MPTLRGQIAQVYLHGKVDHHEIQTVLKAFEDSLETLPDDDEPYFNYMDYVNLMMPERPGSDDWIKRRSDAILGNDGAGMEAALQEIHKEKEAEKRKKQQEKKQHDKEHGKKKR